MAPSLSWVLALAAMMAPLGQDAPKHARPSAELVRAPTAQQYLAAYPQPAFKAKQSGKVTLHCNVVADGSLSGCATTQEVPDGQGFAAASLTLTPFFRLGPGPFPIGGFINLPLTWTPTGFAPVEPPTGPPDGIAASDQRTYDWAKTPTAQDVAEAYPEEAARNIVSGRSAIRCLVKEDGSMIDCQIVSEQPAGYGFGEAELKLAHTFLMKTTAPDGKPVAGDP